MQKLSLYTAAALITLIISGLAVALKYQQDRQRLARLSSETVGEVLNVDVVDEKPAERGHPVTRINYRYKTDGETIVQETSKSGYMHIKYKAGMQVIVCYDPARPEDSEVFLPPYRCGQEEWLTPPFIALSRHHIFGAAF